MPVMLAEGSSFDAIKQAINIACQPAPFLSTSVVAFVVFLAGYRFFTKPVVAGVLGGLTILFFLVSCLDSNFFLIVSKADNVPIVMMMFAVGFVLWMSFRQAALNDQAMEEGRPLIESGSDDKVLVWPDLVYTEMLCMILLTIVMIVWSVVLRAPLEEAANPTSSPNPAKAPWYFLGLQEMLVYFDPWLAGVVLPTLIIVGLMAIPYIDTNPKGNGYYSFRERKWEIGIFLYGFLVLWSFLIITGTFLRGPNWNFFGPYEYWDPNKLVPLVNVDLSELIWVKMLGMTLPRLWIIRELPGIALVLGYCALPPLMAKGPFRRFYLKMGAPRFYVGAMLFLVMLSLPIKMVLRWLFNLKYIVHIQEIFFNV